jgi:hypothetical protein
MNTLLTKLGVSPEIQALFNIGEELLFDYGDGFEHFYATGHKIPITQNIWRAGNELATQVIISASVMELISFIALNGQKFHEPGNLFFIAMGNNYQLAKLKWIRDSLKKRKFILVHANDLLGRLMDIKAATGLKDKSTTLSWSDPFVQFVIAGRSFKIEQDLVSLAAFERQAGIRTHIRTSKPFPFNTYLEQLIYDAK